VTGHLIAVGPPTTTRGKLVKVETEQSSVADRPLCTCVYCRKLGIENQTTPEYRLANDIPVAVDVRQ